MEKFMQKKFATHKRYSSEGSEAITIAINTLIAEASRKEAKKELDSVVVGMPHRGRLATLVILNDYPFRNLLYKASGKNDIPEEIVDRIDDIPTHIAVSNSKKFSKGTQSISSPNHKVTFTMVHNPSHLESQNAISMGKTRAKLDDLATDSKSVLNIQAHGDAAFPGQGAAYEALTLSKLPKFGCQGSLHIITNNQVGFTTNPEDDRSFKYSADIVKPFGVPVLRVNTADPEAVIKACRFLVAYWEKYEKDALIDMIGYRYYGHNEVDEPSFTQPLMYAKIRSLETPP
jgi:probable 2-oxoglutarate dehydrogenase E1 component DHKTD1